MITNKITVLVPTAKPGGKEIPIAPRVQDLNDKIVGLLWNGKPNGDILLFSIKEQLSRRFHLAGTDWQEGRRGGIDDTPIFEELASHADVVINATAD
ncbi:MAG: hypothetical protein HW402_177 [Dehalococcoidales bacterium]|nr:hypothetical protein [Dehalococcoidales bacterium]